MPIEKAELYKILDRIDKKFNKKVLEQKKEAYSSLAKSAAKIQEEYIESHHEALGNNKDKYIAELEDLAVACIRAIISCERL